VSDNFLKLIFCYNINMNAWNKLYTEFHKYLDWGCKWAWKRAHAVYLVPERSLNEAIYSALRRGNYRSQQRYIQGRISEPAL
jgi:ribosomal protein L15E